MAASQAGLLLGRGYGAEAETAFRAATDICPTSPEAVYRCVKLLVQQKRYDDAIPIAENAVRSAPENNEFRTLETELRRLRSQ